MLDDVLLSELVVVHGRDELLEFLERLPPEIAAIHEEQDAVRAGVFHEAISEVDGGKRFARAGGLLDQGAPQASGEGRLQVGDGFDLRGPEVGSVERWELAEALGQLLLLLHPGEERLGAMKGEDVTAARVGIKAAGEAGFGAGAFVAEGEWGFPRGQSRGNAANVFG